MKQIQTAKRPRGSAGGRQEPLPVDPRDPDIVHAHRIARRSSRPARPAAPQAEAPLPELTHAAHRLTLR